MMRGRQQRPQWSALDWLRAQRGPIADHPLRDPFMARLIEQAEANSSRQVALYFMAEARRRTITRRDSTPAFSEAQAKRARKASRLKAQGLEVIDG